MEIEIDSKKNNPLFNRTEIYFTIQHEGEGTPNREIIRSELAEKLNAKKENIIIKNINSSFGVQQSKGYAKIYNSTKYSEKLERKHFLKRNQVSGKKEKEEKKEEEKKPEQKPDDTIEQEEKKETETTTEEKEKTSEGSEKTEEKKE